MRIASAARRRGTTWAGEAPQASCRPPRSFGGDRNAVRGTRARDARVLRGRHRSGDLCGNRAPPRRVSPMCRRLCPTRSVRLALLQHAGRRVAEGGTCLVTVGVARHVAGGAGEAWLSDRPARRSPEISEGSLLSDSVPLAEIPIRHGPYPQEDQWIDDEQNAELSIAPGKMRNAGGEQGDAKSKIGEFFYFRRNVRNQQRQDSQYLGNGELDLEIVRQAQMDESSFFSIGKWKMVIEYKIDDAEHHDGTHDARRAPINGCVPFRRFAHLLIVHGFPLLVGDPDGLPDRVRPIEHAKHELG